MIVIGLIVIALIVSACGGGSSTPKLAEGQLIPDGSYRFAEIAIEKQNGDILFKSIVTEGDLIATFKWIGSVDNRKYEKSVSGNFTMRTEEIADEFVDQTNLNVGDSIDLDCSQPTTSKITLDEDGTVSNEEDRQEGCSSDLVIEIFDFKKIKYVVNSDEIHRLHILPDSEEPFKEIYKKVN